jgi:hypothetical protein
MTKFVLIAIGLLIFSMHANAQNDWIGLYNFDENGGKNAGGTTIFISHELNIFDGGDGLAATLQSNGYQTSSDLICMAKIAGSKLLIYFESYGENNMFEPYNPGDLLLTLERKTEKGKPVILTYWGKFTPAIPKNEKTGKVYFEKSLDKK